MTSTTQKKYLTVFSNIDTNSYRALKTIMNETKANPSKHTRNVSQNMLKSENNMSKYPWALKEKRFKWQTDKIANMGLTVKGTMKTYQNNKSTSRSSWDGMNNVNNDCYPHFKPKGSLVNKMDRRLQENKQTSRTIVPTRASVSPNDSFVTMKAAKKMNYDGNYKLHSSGSIADLIERTSNNEAKPKKYAERLLASNNIFTPDNPEYTRKKQFVPLDEMKKSNAFAGIKYKQLDEVKYYNVQNYLNKKKGIMTRSVSLNVSLDKDYIMKTENRVSDRAFEQTADKSKASKTTLVPNKTSSIPSESRNGGGGVYKKYVDSSKLRSRASKASTNHESYTNLKTHTNRGFK